MQKDNNETMDEADDGKLTIQKKPRTDAQKQATEKMRSALKAKHDAKPPVSKLSKLEEKKIMLKALKDKLNNAPPADDEADEESIEEPEMPTVSQPKKSKPIKQQVIAEDEEDDDEHVPPKKATQANKKKKIIYEDPDDDSEEEVIVIKKQKKKKAKKTIIIEDSDTEEEEMPAPLPTTRATKSQQNRLTKNIMAPAQPPPRYYFDS